MVMPSTTLSSSSSSSSGLLCLSPLRPKKVLRNITSNDVHDYSNEIEATTQETISTSSRRRQHRRFLSDSTSKVLIFKAARNRYRASCNERIRRGSGEEAFRPIKKRSFEIEEPPMVLPKPLSPPISSTSSSSSSSSSKTNITNLPGELNITAAQSWSVLVEDNLENLDYSFEGLRAAFDNPQDIIQDSFQELRV